MGGALIVVLIVLVAYVIVVAGATAYELTGMDRETARFQALSAFTGTGFTTRVSELVVRHPARRRITSTLIILGYAGTATTVEGIGIDEVNIEVVWDPPWGPEKMTEEIRLELGFDL